jgi:restriction system protein
VSRWWPLTTYEAIITKWKEAKPDSKAASVTNRSRQLNAFRNKIKEGDITAIPLKTHPGQVALGIAAGPYNYIDINGEMRHTRKVDWIRADVPRTSFKQDLLYSLGAAQTVCRITRNDAEDRFGQVINGGEDPGYESETADETSAVETDTTEILDIEQLASDEITAYVREQFRGHDMPRLVEAILQAEGFLTHRSSPGPDGGADILAARGPLGLDSPALCVQVKATAAPADVTVFRALQGTMTTFGASQGLLVCWGGFTQAVKNEARQHTFTIRLWDQSDLVEAIYRVYDRLPEEIQAELPLKRVWTLVREDLE